MQHTNLLVLTYAIFKEQYTTQRRYGTIIVGVSQDATSGWLNIFQYCDPEPRTGGG